MDPELVKAALNWGFPAILIVWGIWFFQTQVWSNFVKHLDKLHEMIDSIKVIATTAQETHAASIRSVDIGEELLVRIPVRKEEHR